MTEQPDVTPVEPVEITPPQQDPPDLDTTPPVEPAPVVDPIAGEPDGFVKLERFTGAIQKIDELTTSLSALKVNIATLTSDKEQLTLQLQSKGQEQDIVVGERDRMLSTQVEELASLKAEIVPLRAYKRKVEMAIELKRPEVIMALHIIPDMDSDEALRGVILDVLGFRDEGALQRERELTSGVIPHTPIVDDVPTDPTTVEGWERKVASLQPGSEERAEAVRKQGDFLFKKK